MVGNARDRCALDLRELFAENFRRLRLGKRLSQRQVTGVSQKTVSAAELSLADLRLSTMVRMADALGEEVAALLEKPKATAD